MTSIFTNEFKQVDMIDFPTRGRKIFIKATVAELRGDRIICKNKHGHYYSVTPSEVYVRQKAKWIQKSRRKFVCPECGYKAKQPDLFCGGCGSRME